MKKICLFFLFLSVLLHVPLLLPAAENLPDISIGVLYKRSPTQCLKQWQPLADYLNSTIKEVNFIIVPFGFQEIEEAVAENSIDFIVSNPAIYVNLEAKYQVTRITTMENMLLGNRSSKFGGVLFSRRDRKDIRDAIDLKGMDFMAVSPTSFGGWITSWRYLQERKIDPAHDFASLHYGGSHDKVVQAVENGEVDAGAIRSGILELMAMEGKINLLDFYVIDDKRDHDESTFMHTTRLYPEWAFAMLVDTDRKLAEKVTVALLNMQPGIVSAANADNATWTIPLDYQAVHQCLKKLNIKPYENFGRITGEHLVEQHPLLILLLIAVLIAAWLTSIYFLTLNRRLKASTILLDNELESNKIMEKRLLQFKLTLDQTLDCVFMFDPQSLIYIYANHGAMALVGYSMVELLQMTSLDLKPDYTEKEYRATLSPLLRGEQKTLIFTTTHRTKEGIDVPVEIVQQYITLGEGEHRFISIVRDISGRLAAENEKEKMQIRLLQTQKLESVGQLAAGIAHEINTPTQFIGTNIDFMDEAVQDLSGFMKEMQKIADSASDVIGDRIRDGLEEADWEYLAEELPRAISQSREGVQRVSSIVLAMKEFSHPSSREKVAQDLNHLIETTVTVAGSEWKYVADMDMNLDPDLPLIPLLADEMGQVILNVLVNAAQAISEKIGTDPDGEKGIITISTTKVNDTVQLRIHDTGNGIPEQARERIFDPFYTTKEVGKGTGQGLAISHGVVTEKHGGSINFTTETGAGTEFVITLPLEGVSYHDE